jgi:hypothetical protein
MWLRLLLPRRGRRGSLRSLIAVRRAAVLVSAGCLALVVAGCGGSSKPAHRRSTTTSGAAGGNTATSTATLTTTAAKAPPPTPAEIQRAAKLAANEPGYSAAVSAQIAVPDFHGNHLTAVGHGQFDPSTDSGTLNVAVTLPGLLSLAGALPTQVRIVGSEAYVRVPSDLASEDPGVKPWLEVSLSELGLDDVLNPSDLLREVARDATSNVAGQRARVTLDPLTGKVRTIMLTYSQPSPRAHVRLTLHFTGFGPEPPTVAPPADQVGDLASALQQLGF